jgi:DNA polymerase-3 subunit delta
MIKDSVNYQQLIAELKNRIFYPVYFLHGDEPYYIDKISDYILNHVLPEAEKAFNQTVLYGRESDAAAVTNNARRFPMMANQQVVVVREAQDMKDFENLVHYLGNPLKSTLLVICYKYKSLDKRKKIYKAIQDNALIFESKKIYDDRLPDWITAVVKARNYIIEAKAAVLLSEFIGNDLSRLENELEKLFITLPSVSKTITADHIERNIGISKEYNIFELQSALSQKDVLKANRIIRYFAANPKNNHIIPTIAQLYSYFSKILLYHTIEDKSKLNVASILKINPFFVAEYEKASRSYSPGKIIQIISLLREYDLRSKGFENTSTDDGDLLKELIYKIIH